MQSLQVEQKTLGGKNTISLMIASKPPQKFLKSNSKIEEMRPKVIVFEVAVIIKYQTGKHTSKNCLSSKFKTKQPKYISTAQSGW